MLAAGFSRSAKSQAKSQLQKCKQQGNHFKRSSCFPPRKRGTYSSTPRLAATQIQPQAASLQILEAKFRAHVPTSPFVWWSKALLELRVKQKVDGDWLLCKQL